ncbi:MAG TPA: hypothetical protein PK398_00880 [Candidatus Gracilibacteria bacterium]|nr:hypothetical protein [Candidatus Gracilibacteria bacterium]
MTIVEIIGLVVASGLFSGAVAAIVSHWSVSNINRKEREFALKKEEYLKLKEKAEDVFGYMHYNDSVLDYMLTQLQNHIALWQEFRADEEVKKHKKRIFEIMHVYFYEISTAYNEYAHALGNCINVYFDCARDSQMTKENADKLNAGLPVLRQKQYDLTQAIIGLLDQKREEIFK